MTIPVRSIRLTPKSDYTRFTGSRGEIFYDPVNNTLRVFNSEIQGGVSLARADLNNVSKTAFVSLATSSGLFGPNIHIHNTVVNSNLLSGDKDYVTFTVGTNDITALYLTKYVGVDLKAFFAIQEGNAWTAGQNVNLMLTYGHLGPWDPSLAVGSNVLAGNPLHPGAVTLTANTTYTMWIQQTGSNITEYALSTNPFWVPATADLPADYSSDPATPTILYQDGAGQGGGGTTVITNNVENSYSFSVAGDDSTLREITNGESIKFLGAGGIAVTTDADGNITITGAGTTGNITFAGNVIDSQDSTAITVTPAVNFESDVVVGNEIVFADGTRQSTSAVGIPGPTGPQGPQGASGSGSGDVLSAGGSYVDNQDCALRWRNRHNHTGQ
jgi:hypothetical protein